MRLMRLNVINVLFLREISGKQEDFADFLKSHSLKQDMRL